MICGNAWREDVSRADVLKILSNILESMENRERKNNVAVNIREEKKADLPDIFEGCHGKSGRSKDPAGSCERENTKEKEGRIKSGKSNN